MLSPNSTFERYQFFIRMCFTANNINSEEITELVCNRKLQQGLVSETPQSVHAAFHCLKTEDINICNTKIWQY